jgi:Tfp pilus assembly protein PilP
MRALLLFLVVWVLTPAPLRAMQGPSSPAKQAAPQGQPPPSQGQPAPPQPAAPQGQPAAPQGQPPPGGAPAAQAAPAEPYTYDPAGRRDPFLDLLGVGTGTDLRPMSSRPGGGVAGLAVGDISVRGVMQSRGGFYAMVQGPDGKTFMIRAKDKLLDGTVKAVNAEGLVIVQEVNDPLSLVKEREITKRLRSLEAKQ